MIGYARMLIYQRYHSPYFLLELFLEDCFSGTTITLAFLMIKKYLFYNFRWIADHYGRIPALAGCNIIGFIAGVSTAFVGNFWQFSLCRFFVGFAFDNCFTMMYILGTVKIYIYVFIIFGYLSSGGREVDIK